MVMADLQVGRQVPVPGRLTDVHPVAVEQVIGDLPPAEAERDYLGPLPGEEEGPQSLPVVAARRGRTRRAGREHLELRVEVAADRGLVGHALHPVVLLGIDGEPHAQRQSDGVTEEQEPHRVPAVGAPERWSAACSVAVRPGGSGNRTRGPPEALARVRGAAPAGNDGGTRRPSEASTRQTAPATPRPTKRLTPPSSRQPCVLPRAKGSPGTGTRRRSPGFHRPGLPHARRRVQSAP